MTGSAGGRVLITTNDGSPIFGSERRTNDDINICAYIHFMSYKLVDRNSGVIVVNVLTSQPGDVSSNLSRFPA